jgi:uncharacterized protein (DUF362 family)/Pyruvate/2-oxoacid:ferredoxin oxidoreductase delta subunit
MKYRVSCVGCRDYSLPVVRDAVAESIARCGGMASFLSPGDRVLIKPNLLAAAPPGHAVTTHPSVVQAVVEEVHACGAEAVIGDSPGGHTTPATYRALLNATGMQDVIERTGAGVAYFDETAEMISSKNGRIFKKFTITAALKDADAVIAIPKFKTHQFTGFTGAVKLLYGYVPGVTKAEYHLHAGRDVGMFAELLLDIWETLPPALTIMDAVVAMEGAGPRHGHPRQMGVVLAGQSGPAIDMVAATIAGMDPLAMPTVRRAAERGLGPAGMDEIELLGVPADDMVVSDFQPAHPAWISKIPPLFFSAAQRMFTARPVIDEARCTGCGTCVASCPPGAMAMGRGRIPRIDTQYCIRCYCCQELCPAGAVEVGVPLIRRILRAHAQRPP